MIQYPLFVYGYDKVSQSYDYFYYTGVQYCLDKTEYFALYTSGNAHATNSLKTIEKNTLEEKLKNDFR